MIELSDRVIDEIQKAVKVEIIKDSKGTEFSTGSLHRVPEKEFDLPDPILISTLTGFTDYCNNIKSQPDEPGAPKFIHVVDHQSVILVSDLFGPAKQRAKYVKTCFVNLIGESFRFGQYYDQESFIVGIQSLFEPTPSRTEVLKVIGTIKENTVRDHSDDGVSQSVSAKSGVALVAEVKVPNPVKLRPFRTFREIEQPESPFVLRVKVGPEKPLCALFEADGGSWKLEAIELIRDYLKLNTHFPIFA